MTSAMAAFGVAVCGTSLVCFMLMTRVQNRCTTRRPSRGGSPDSSSFASGDSVSDGGGLFTWSAGDHSASDHPGASNDAGGATAEAAAITGEAVTAVVEAINAAQPSG
jgi:hypothetical protein